MATVNGHLDSHEISATPSTSLRKRKRSHSPEKLSKSVAELTGPALQRSISNVIRELKRHEFGPLLLQQNTRIRSTPTRASKRLRTEVPAVSIEDRIASNSYESIDDFLDDIENAKHTVAESDSGNETGDVKSRSKTIDRIVSQYRKSGGNIDETSDNGYCPPGEALTLRSTVEGGGVRQLFSGLRKIPESVAKVEAIDAKLLPNGFEVVEAATLDLDRTKKGKDPRTFGQVFQPHRNVKSLELPRTNQGSRRNVLDFVKPFEEVQGASKHDYRSQALHSGSWLSYSTTSQELKPKQSSSTPAADVESRSQALFKASYSSFAPSYDNTDSMVSTLERSRRWWHKYGHLHPLLAEVVEVSDEPELPQVSEKDMEEFVENYKPDELDDALRDESESDETDEGGKVLSEISELLETLSSYQYLRDLERKQNLDSAPKPSENEFNIYDLLKTQLKLLVDSLPPFAVAKLDGDQLKALDISSKIVVHTPEYSGTGQADEYTMRRNRAAQAQQANVVGRPPNTPQNLGRNYQNNNYNAQARTYNSNTHATPAPTGYGQRPNTALYNTPRPNVPVGQPAYGQTPYQQQRPYPNATIQQYQRSLQNGYNQTSTPQYAQRTPQPTQQSPTQTQIQTPHGRSDSPQKSMTNGVPPNQQQQPNQQQGTPKSGAPFVQAQAQAQAHATIQQFQAMERMKALQEAQRQASGTPQPSSEANEQAKTPTPAPESEAPQTQPPQQAVATTDQQAAEA